MVVGFAKVWIEGNTLVIWAREGCVEVGRTLIAYQFALSLIYRQVYFPLESIFFFIFKLTRLLVIAVTC